MTAGCCASPRLFETRQFGLAVRAGARLDDGLVDCMVERFIAENVRPTFRLTSLEAPDSDAVLEHFRRSSRRGC